MTVLEQDVYERMNIVLRKVVNFKLTKFELYKMALLAGGKSPVEAEALADECIKLDELRKE